MSARPLAAIAPIPAAATSPMPTSAAAEPEDPGRSEQEAADVRVGLVLVTHLELLALGEPAPDRLVERGLQLGGDVRPRRRARAPVEELVRAADREFDAGAGQVHLDRPGGVGEVPHHDCAGLGGARRLRPRSTSSAVR